MKTRASLHTPIHPAMRLHWLIVTLVALLATAATESSSGFVDQIRIYNAVLTPAQVAALGAPTVTSISPSSGTSAGGTSVTLTGMNFTGGASSITATRDGAHLRALMQRLEGEATAEGLWLTSNADEDAGKPNRFRIKASALGRASSVALPATGVVRASTDSAAWLRPGVVEEYGVSTDGVRQDFLVLQRPAGAGDELAVDLAISGARAAAADEGVKLTVADTGRELAYSRLKVTDATGRELSSRFEVAAPDRLRIVVQDAGAVYPVRIDPTFSDADWVSLGGLQGASSTVGAAVADGSGNLYVGGSFTAIGAVAANRIAKWNGSAWSALGTGMDNGVNALVVIGTDLYAGGGFTTAGGVANTSRIAKWNGSAWSALGTGMNTGVNALAVSGTDLYAGGTFTTAGGVLANRIAKWDGSTWSALGTGVDSTVSALAMSGTELYVGGSFTAAGGVANTSRIAKWNGSAWSALGTGMNNSVSALAVSGTNLYAGGSFTTAGGVTVGRVAKWDGSAWSVLGTGVDSTVSALAVIGTTDLYVGGSFTAAGGVANTSRIAKWNGSAWSALGTGMDSSVSALAVIGTNLYAGGNFTTAGGLGAVRIAKWDGSAWSALGTGMNNAVNALAVIGTDLYAGGSFTTAGVVSANRIAKWNGSAWSALGTGMNSNVRALAVIGTDLYAGGDFSTAGGVSTIGIAKWNGSGWSALGTGMNGSVSALAVSGTNLYASGGFTTAGGLGAIRIAKWNGSAWSALGTGMDSDAVALAVIGTDLYAGGFFTTAGGVAASRIAKWNGSVWSALGTGMDSAVNALAVIGTDLYAGGTFTTAGGGSASNIAKWDGSAWSALGSGINSSVLALAVSGTDLYAGGTFTTAGGVSANRIAKWVGSVWSALGSGVNSTVRALAADASGHLFLGGDFTLVGTTVSGFAAQANLISVATAPTVNTPTSASVTSSTATLGGNVTSDGNATITERGVVFAVTTTNANPLIGGSGVTQVTASGTTGVFTANATSLAFATGYSFKAYAINSQGTTYTSTATFTTLAVVPGAPTIGTATGGNAMASVAFTAPASNGGSAITGYTVTSSPGGITGTGSVSPITVNGLTNGTAYTFTVTATNAVGTGAASAASNSVTPVTVPGAPTIGTATGGNALASVAFTAPASNGGSAITGYTVTSSPGGITGTGSVSPITVNGLTNGTAYTFTVTATNAVGTGAASAASNSVTPATVPGAPTIGTATRGNASASVAFTAPASNGGSAITSYTVTSSPGGFTGSGAASPITVNGLTNGTAYTFTVTATNAVGTGAPSAASNSVTPAAVPGAPTIGTATGGNALASVTFTAPANNGGSPITGYTVTSSPGGFTGTGVASPITVNGLTNGTAYTFTVTATNAAGTGAASAASNSVTPATVPGAPTIGTATGGNASASVTFTAPASNGGSAITSYTVTSSPGGITGTGSVSPITVNGLTNGTAYTFTVTATNAAGTGAASAASNSVTPATIPGAPTIGTATRGNASASVAFTAPASNGGSAITGYTVTSSPGGFTGSGAASPITVNGLTNGTAYTFTVTATNAVGTGAASAASNSVTPATVPGAPTIGSATGGNALASVTFTAPSSNGGSAITGYTVTSSPGGFTGSGAASPITVSGLTNGATYTFTVTATNAVGTGAASAASNAVTPVSASTTTTLTSSQNNSAFLTPPTFTAQATSAQAGIAGQMQLFIDNVLLESKAIDASGTATFTPSASALAVGSRSIRAVFVGTTNFATSNVTITQTVIKSTLTPTLGALSQVYNGTGRAATASVTIPPTHTSVQINLTYDGSATLPVNVGSYAVVATINDPSLQGTTSGTLTITKAAATVFYVTTAATYDGLPHAAELKTNPSVTPIVVTYQLYNGGVLTGIPTTTAPTARGTYKMVPSHPNYDFTPASESFTIKKGKATIKLGNLSVVADGSPKPVSVTTIPAGLPVDVIYGIGDVWYSGAPSMPPAGGGLWKVAATVTSPEYSGFAEASLEIRVVKQTPTLTLTGPTTHTYGTAQIYTATLSPPAGKTVKPTGTITFYQNGVEQLTVSPASDGTATWTTYTPASTTSSYLMTAQYSGDANYLAATSTSVTTTVSKKVFETTFPAVTTTYDGTPKVLYIAKNLFKNYTIVSTEIWYDDSVTAPVGARATPFNVRMIFTLTDPSVEIRATMPMTIKRATGYIRLGNLDQYWSPTQSSYPVTIWTMPSGLRTDITYLNNGTSIGSTGPNLPGVYQADASITDPNYEFVTVRETLTVSNAPVSFAFANVVQDYDGKPKVPTITSSPSIAYNVTYNGGTKLPVAPGDYNVVVTPVRTDLYSGSRSVTLTIRAKVEATIINPIGTQAAGIGEIAIQGTEPAGYVQGYPYYQSYTSPAFLPPGKYKVGFTAAAATGGVKWRFSKWEDGSKENPRFFTVGGASDPSSYTFKAIPERLERVVIYTEGSGKVTGQEVSENRYFADGEVVRFDAEAGQWGTTGWDKAGYVFDSWKYDGQIVKSQISISGSKKVTIGHRVLNNGKTVLLKVRHGAGGLLAKFTSGYTAEVYGARSERGGGSFVRFDRQDVTMGPAGGIPTGVKFIATALPKPGFLFDYWRIDQGVKKPGNPAALALNPTTFEPSSGASLSQVFANFVTDGPDLTIWMDNLHATPEVLNASSDLHIRNDGSAANNLHIIDIEPVGYRLQNRADEKKWVYYFPTPRTLGEEALNNSSPLTEGEKFELLVYTPVPLLGSKLTPEYKVGNVGKRTTVDHEHFGWIYLKPDLFPNYVDYFEIQILYSFTFRSENPTRIVQAECWVDRLFGGTYTPF